MSQLTDHRKDQVEMHRSVAEMYKRRAGYRFAHEFQEERNEVLVAMAPGDVNGWAVDLGCGTGIMLDHLARKYGHVTGIDLSHEMLEGYPRDNAAVAGLIRGDMTALPLQDASLDMVLCRSALHHMDDEVAVLTEMCRILKPDGSLVVGEPANDFPLFRLARWWVKRRPSFGKIHTIDRAYTRRQLRDLLARAGLEVAQEKRFGFVGYVVCDNPDLVPVLKWLPEPVANGVARFLRGVDRVLAHVPLIKNWSWYTMLEVRRANAAG